MAPYSFIVLIRAQSHRKKYTWSFLEEAKKILISQKPNFSILGPVSAPMEKKASHYRGQLLLQSEGRKSLNQSLKVFIDEIERKKFVVNFCTIVSKKSKDLFYIIHRPVYRN